jgi:hypothetical protein
MSCLRMFERGFQADFDLLVLFVNITAIHVIRMQVVGYEANKTALGLSEALTPERKGLR